LYYTLRKNRRNAFIAGLIVFSHWILDFLAHRPDLPLSFFGGPYFGLGLWYSLPGTLVAEFLLFAIGIALYVRTTKAKDKVGSIGFWTLAVVLGVMYLANLFGPPPPDVSLIAVAGNASYRGYKLPAGQAKTQNASCSV
jgi:hypothetical protein